MIRPTSRKSSSSKPRIVAAGVPIRTPEATVGDIGDAGGTPFIVGGRIQLDQKKRIPMYKEAQRLLMNDLVQVPLVAVSKFQVVRPRVANMYVAFSDFNTGLHTSVYIKR